MHSAVTPAQIAVMALLIAQSYALWFWAAPFWRRQRSRLGVALCRIVAIGCGASGGVVLMAWVMYGTHP